MKKYLCLALCATLWTGNVQTTSAVTPAKSSKKIESLTYNAYWHWGFIWKLAGSGVLNQWEETLADGSVRRHGQLCGRSLSIVETIMKVRDTLDCYYTPQLVPLEYCKKTNEGSYRAIERNYYHSYVDGRICKSVSEADRADIDSTVVDVYRWRSKKGNDRRRLSNEGVGFDMLSIFYELRNINFDSMKKGDRLDYYITAGVRNQCMHITYKGRQTCTMKSGKKYPSYAVELTFASKDSDSTPVQAWLSTDPDHRPLSVVINLKRIGAVQGELVE